MSKMKDTATKSKSSAMTKPEGGDRLAREQRISAAMAKGFKATVDAGAYSEGSEAGVVDQADLIKVPFLVIDWKENMGDFGPYAFVTCQLQDDSVVSFTDGGSGILPALQAHASAGLELPLYVKGGLKQSNYISKQTNQPSITYWFNFAPSKEEMSTVAAASRGANGKVTKNARA